jgi:hypothetical protein
MRTRLTHTSIKFSLLGLFSGKRLSLGLVVLSSLGSFAQSVRADYPVRRTEARADLRGPSIYSSWVPYRKEMNRPRFIGGYIASKIEPTSQEAMSWREHHAEGAYRDHRPGYVKTYYYPKPWEVLPIDPRPAAPFERVESERVENKE